ncbi:hypothetical protein ACYEXS_32875 [Paenibacillus sp. MAH-36]|uniref:hypothetical protein n=1 Tax=Paenibacillus violae TaxID=3077234 RepID=UPI0028FC2849|nr:hypothetical protein [Paenibacillus sp. PFR10]
MPSGSRAPLKPTGHGIGTPAISSCSTADCSKCPIVLITKVPPGMRLNPPIVCNVRSRAILDGKRNKSGLNIE